MKRIASLSLVLVCIAVSGCRRAVTARQPEPTPQVIQTVAQPQPTVCVAENLSRAALLQKPASPTPQPRNAPASKK